MRSPHSRSTENSYGVSSWTLFGAVAVARPTPPGLGFPCACVQRSLILVERASANPLNLHTSRLQPARRILNTICERLEPVHPLNATGFRDQRTAGLS